MESERFVHRADVPARLKKKKSSSRAGPHGERPLKCSRAVKSG